MAELATLRKTRGLSQRELATRANVSPATIYEMEAGRRSQPRGSTLRKLADALEVDVSELVEDFYVPKDSSLLSAERALRLSEEAFAAEIKAAETDRLRKLLSELVGDDVPKTKADLKAGREGISQGAFMLALEVRGELLKRGEKPPENDGLPTFKKRLEALQIV